MARMNDYSKRLLKALVPPVIYDAARSTANKKSYHPAWTELERGPARGMKMFFDATGPWQKKIVDGTYDAFLFERIKGLDLQGKAIYDIGSHVGFHALSFSRLVGERGAVAAFEPNKANFERLEKNIEGNLEAARIVRALNVAASDHAGSISFTTTDDVEGGRSTGGFIEGADAHWDKATYRKKGFVDTTVEAVKLDDAAGRFGIPDPALMKIDVEGAEHQVLMGARKLIERAKPAIFVEVHSIAAMHDVDRFFARNGYEVRLVNKEPNGVCYLQAVPAKA